VNPSLLSDAFSRPMAEQRHLERASSAPVQLEPSSHRDPIGLMGFGGLGGGGTSMVQGGAGHPNGTAMDSLVDNISTGIGGPALWGATRAVAVRRCWEI